MKTRIPIESFAGSSFHVSIRRVHGLQPPSLDPSNLTDAELRSEVHREMPWPCPWRVLPGIGRWKVRSSCPSLGTDASALPQLSADPAPNSGEPFSGFLERKIVPYEDESAGH